MTKPSRIHTAELFDNLIMFIHHIANSGVKIVSNFFNYALLHNVSSTNRRETGREKKKRLYRNQSLQRNIIETETQVIVGHVLCFGLVLVTMRKILGKSTDNGQNTRFSSDYFSISG